ncbi:MAG: nitroreductase family protein [Candidatus Thorarchaeota archaeon]
MDIEKAIYSRRTIRRFKQDSIPIEILKKLIDYARLAPSGMNIQGLEYIIISNQQMRNSLFPLLRWAALLPEGEQTPEIGRQPTAYIIVLGNTQIKRNVDIDVGAAIENILLGALNYGVGSCWMGSIDRDKIRELFKIPEQYLIKYVISLGYPDEESVTEPFNGSFKYWKEENTMHIPKRDLDEIIFKII